MILVFGKSGQVATELSKFNDVLCVGRDSLNLEDPHSCADVINQYRPKAVINAAGYTSVDQAEVEEVTALRVNSAAPATMALACKNLGIPFVHISTDYVFNGSGCTAWNTDDATGPLGAYGRSKCDGELAVVAINPEAIVLRTSWVFSSTGTNFVKTMLRLARNSSELTIVSDQIGGPTSARSVAATCFKIATDLMNSDANVSKKGFYHFSGAPDVSWAVFAEEIFAQIQNKVFIKKILTVDYPTLAKRPLNSRLDCTKLENDFQIARPEWKTELKRVLVELKELN